MGRVTHSRCPKCAERGADTRGNNLATYPDGGQHCFACGYHIGTSGRKQEAVEEVEEVMLPEDVSPIIRDDAITWYYSFGMSHGDVVANKLLWSEENELLIFPIFSGDVLHAWQGRNFGGGPKWRTQGRVRSKVYVCNPRRGGSLVMVEDIVSWQKLRKFGIMVGCCFGQPSKDLIKKYIELSPSLVVWWLDHDKRLNSIKARDITEGMGVKSSCIFSIEDPKEYSYPQIKEFLHA